MYQSEREGEMGNQDPTENIDRLEERPACG